MDDTIYLRLRNRVQVKSRKIVTLEDAAQMIGEEHILSSLRKIPVHFISNQDNSFAVLDIMAVIREIKKVNPSINIETLGPDEAIIEIKKTPRAVSFPLFIVVWLLLFIGSAFAIINFHEEVGMLSIHQKFYLMITGEKSLKPILLQIPYSLGLGVGMILFFNHLFNKRFNEEPSPLEIEMFNYQQDLDQFVLAKENKESTRDLDDD